MEQEQILSTLKEKLGQTSLSERTISGYVSRHLPAEGIEPDESYFNTMVADLKDLDGNYSHDVAEYKRNNPVPKVEDAPKVEPKVETPTNDDAVAKLTEQITALQKRLDEQDATAKAANLLRDVEAGMKAKGANDDYVLRNTLKGVTLDANKGVDALVDVMMAEYEKEYVACRGADAVPHVGGGGAKGQTACDAYFANKPKSWLDEVK